VALSPTEFRLLACLMAAPGDAVRRRGLIGAAWPHGAMVSHNTLDQYIARLRRKLRDAGSDAGIETVRGIGYRYG
jgi:DNA-binding response OmpR family regulator